MKRITSIELGLLVIASMFLVAGIIWLVRPTDVGSVQFVRYGNGKSGELTKVSAIANSRVYGVIAIVIGIGIGAFVLYRPKDQTSGKSYAKEPLLRKYIRQRSAKPKSRTMPSSETLDR